MKLQRQLQRQKYPMKLQRHEASEAEIPHEASEAETLLLEWEEYIQASLVLENYFIQRVDIGNLKKSVSSGESK